MSIARSAKTEEIPQNGEGWAQDFRFWADRAMTQPRDLAEGRAELRRRGGAAGSPPPPFLLTVGNGRIQLTGNTCGLRISAGDVPQLQPGDYELVVDVVYDTGWPRQVRKPVKVLP